MSCMDAFHFSVFDTGIEILAGVIGIAMLIFIVNLNRRLGGKMRTALWYFALAVMVNILGLVWTACYGDNYMLGSLEVDMHDVIMAVGMIFFSISVYRFSLLVPHE